MPSAGGSQAGKHGSLGLALVGQMEAPNDPSLGLGEAWRVDTGRQPMKNGVLGRTGQWARGSGDLRKPGFPTHL